MWQKFKNRGVQVLALAIQERAENPHAVPAHQITAFRKEHHLTYPILSDETAVQIQKFGFQSIPSNVILDRKGRYVAAPGDVDAIVAALKKLVK